MGMRFIVDFYRYVILAGIALMIVGLIYGTLVLATQRSEISQFSAPMLFIGVLVIGLVVMSLGMTATFISVHDRHAEIVDELRALRADLERRA
jgi:hypothetical protein